MHAAWDATFSIVCRCRESGDLAVAVSTARLAVGSRVPFVLAGGAAVATQARTNPALGYAALAAVRSGLGAEEAMALALRGDEERESRQLSIIDAAGKSAVFTGREVLERSPWAGSMQGADCAVAGNLLAGSAVPEAMAEAFEAREGFLGDRALAALEAGQGAGGDKRGKVSAALLLARPGLEHPLLDLRVDHSADPVADLRRLYIAYLEAFPLPGPGAP